MPADYLPIFVTEWGTQTCTGDGANDVESSQQWIDLMAEKKISWTSWNFSDDWRSGAVLKTGACPNGPWTGTGLKESGLEMDNFDVPIAPVSFDEQADTQAFCEKLRKRGIVAPYSTYPGSPNGGMVRIAVTANHTEEQIDRLVEAVREIS